MCLTGSPFRMELFFSSKVSMKTEQSYQLAEELKTALSYLNKVGRQNRHRMSRLFPEKIGIEILFNHYQMVYPHILIRQQCDSIQPRSER